jgi:hypothetical protein
LNQFFFGFPFLHWLPEGKDNCMNSSARYGLLAQILTKQEAARELNRSTRSLDRWHTERKGPPRFLVGGRVAYDRRDVERWVEEQKAKTSLY